MKRILIYGFGGFRGFTKNPSQDIIGYLKSKLREENQLQFHVFEVSYTSIEREMRTILERGDIQATIGIGLWPGISGLRLESLALNLVNKDEKDNEGASMSGGVIESGGPMAFASSLDLEALRGELLTRGIPAYVSHDPDTFACNYSYYLSSLYFHGLSPEPHQPVLFVHIPLTPDLVTKHHVKVASLGIDMMREGVEVLVSRAIGEFSGGMIGRKLGRDLP